MLDTLTDTDFDTLYQELLAEHVSGDCPEDCAFCLEDGEKSPLRIGQVPSVEPERSGYQFTFGRHKGKTLREVPADYLDWALNLPCSAEKKDTWLRQAKNAIRRFQGKREVPEPRTKEQKKHRKNNSHRRR